jgi:protein required for attachment to host cells
MDTTWILVADRARARLFELNDPRQPLSELDAWMNPDGRAPVSEMVRDQRGRSFDRFGEGRHGNEPSTHPKEKSAERFARELQATLEQGRVEHRFEHLVLMAPPPFLGTLNQVLGTQLHSRVTASIDKDLTQLSAEELRDYLPPGVRH